MNLIHPILAAALLTVGFSLPAAAAEDASELLERLRSAPAAEARQIERTLERTWSQSGSVALNMLLERGRSAMEAGDFLAAVEHFTALTDHAPDFAEGWHARATAFYKSEKYGPALDDLGRALALNPDNYNAIFGLGVMFNDFGDYPRAETAFRRVLELNPTHETATQALERLKREGIGRAL